MGFKLNPLTGQLDLVGSSGGGTGTVTSVSVVSANGVSGSVANATTTPAITLALGAITPSSLTTSSETLTGSQGVIYSTSGVLGSITDNSSSTQKFLTQVSSGTPSWQTLPAQGSLTYYLQDTASAVATYKKLIPSPFTPKTTETYTPANGTHVIQNYITEAGFPGLAYIPAGSFEFHIHASRASGLFTVYAEFWESDSSGVDIAKIGTSEQAVVDTTEAEYRLYFVTANTYNMATSASRITCRLYAITSSSATCRLYVGDEADSHISLPSNTVDATNFVPYIGATSNLDMGAHTISGTQLTSTIAIGTAPLVVTSTTPVTNLSIGGNAATATTAGSVTNATLTTALTVDTGTVQLSGDVGNTSHLTIGVGSVSVSGSNTGDQTGGTPALTLGTTNTAGNASTFLRTNDTILAFDATALTAEAIASTSSVGTATVAARRDHRHPMPTALAFLSGVGGGYAACATAIGTQAKTVALTGYTLVVGGTVGTTFTNGNSAAAPTMNINSAGAKPIFLNGAAAAAIPAGFNCLLMYDGTNYNITTSVLPTTAGKTLTATNSIALAGTDGTTMTFPSTSDTVAGLAAIQTITGAWTYNDGKLIMAGSSSGTTTLKATAAAGSTTATFPAANITVAANDGSNLTISGQAIGDIPVASSTTAYGKLAASTAGKVLTANGTGAAPVWSTPTFPNASATTRKIIVSDGTNWLASTETYAVPGTSGNVLSSDGTNWASKVPSTVVLSNPYKFSVYRSTAYNSGNGAFAKVQFDIENFDTGNNYDNSTNYRFTAPIAGFYFFNFCIQTGAAATNLIGSIYKNNAEFRRFRFNATTASGSGCSGSDLILLAANDYIEIFCFAAATTAMDQGADRTFFSGFLVSAT